MLLWVWIGSVGGAEAGEALEMARSLVALEDRRAEASGGQAAQRMMAERLEELGYDVRRSEAPLRGWVVGCRDEERGPTGLVLAHTDAVHEDCPGAVDNAGSVGVALSVAEQLRYTPTELALCFAFPNGEERGLLGAQALAEAWDEVWPTRELSLVVSMEFMGSGRPAVASMDRGWGRAGMQWVVEHGDVDIPFSYRVVARSAPHATERSDHAPFSWRGVPSVFLVGRDEDGVYWPYHTARDDLDQLDPDALLAAEGALLGLLRAPPPPKLTGDAALPFPGTRVMVPGSVVVGMLGAGLGLGLAGLRGWRAALQGLLVTLLATTAGSGAWMAAARGRADHGALAEPLTLAWAGAALAVALAAAGRTRDGLAGGALAAAVTAAPMLLVDVTLAAVFAAGGLGLGIAQRHRRGWLLGLALALPLPIYLSLPDVWRELVFQYLLPEGGLWWMPGRALLWWPLLCAALALPTRARAFWPIGLLLALAGIAWAWSMDPWAAPYFEREMLW